MNSAPRVLVVDDVPEISALIEQILTAGGYGVETARDGGTALARLDTDIALVLLDVMMPDLNGLQVCRRIRARDHVGDVPIIMVTALGGEGQRHAGFAAGADDYITKPFVAQELLDRVQVWTRARERFLRAAPATASPAASGEGGPPPDEISAGPPPLAPRAEAIEEQVLQVEGLLQYLVREATTRPGFLASLLMPYAYAQGWDEDEFALQLGCPRATLARLLLRPRPLALTWATDVARIAEACGAEATTLATALRAAEAWEQRMASVGAADTDP